MDPQVWSTQSAQDGEKVEELQGHDLDSGEAVGGEVVPIVLPQLVVDGEERESQSQVQLAPLLNDLAREGSHMNQLWLEFQHQ